MTKVRQVLLVLRGYSWQSPRANLCNVKARIETAHREYTSIRVGFRTFRRGRELVGGSAP